MNSSEIKLERQAQGFLQIPAGELSQLSAALSAADELMPTSRASDNAAAFRAMRVRGEQNLVIIFGAEIPVARISHRLVKFGRPCRAATYALPASATTPTRAARPTWVCYPDLLPGYHPVADAGNIRTRSGVELPADAWLDPAGNGGQRASWRIESALCGGCESGRTLRHRSLRFLADTFVVVQDMFLTETAALADVVLPAANAYEKSGTVTNTCGDLQLVKKAGEKRRQRSRISK